MEGVSALTVRLTDGACGVLNPTGINCLRALPGIGPVVWGGRTLRGDDAPDEFKYVPVRRTALFIEASIDRGTGWATFEPNDEPLWVQLRRLVELFMLDLYRQAAFQGQTPREAFFVKCDEQTTTSDDINAGIVNIVVGFAPLRPSEFVVLKVHQSAGRIPP